MDRLGLRLFADADVVLRRHIDVAVAQEFGDHLDRGAGFHQLRGKGVAVSMKSPAGDADLPVVAVERALQGSFVIRIAVTGQEDHILRAFAALPVVPPGPPYPVLPQGGQDGVGEGDGAPAVQGFRREEDVAGFSAAGQVLLFDQLPLHVEGVALDVPVLEAQKFADSEAGVHHKDDHETDVGNLIQAAGDFQQFLRRPDDDVGDRPLSRRQPDAPGDVGNVAPQGQETAEPPQQRIEKPEIVVRAAGVVDELLVVQGVDLIQRTPGEFRALQQDPVGVQIFAFRVVRQVPGVDQTIEIIFQQQPDRLLRIESPGPLLPRPEGGLCLRPGRGDEGPVPGFPAALRIQRHANPGADSDKVFLPARSSAGMARIGAGLE